MTDASNPVSVAILVLLSFISLILTGYLSMYCYSHYKLKEDKRLSLEDFSHWLDTERKPLIPGNFHTETIQPVSPHSDDVNYFLILYFTECIFKLAQWRRV